MQALREHFEPIIAQQEDDYNEQFCLDTQVQVRNLTKVEGPVQISPILNAIKSQNKTITNAILKSNQAIVEAIQTSKPAPSPLTEVNWTPLIQAVATGLAQAFGAQVSFPTTPSPTTAPAAVSSAAQTPGEVQTLNTRLDRLEQLIQQHLPQHPAQSQVPQEIISRLNKLEKMVVNQVEAQTQLTNTVNTLTKAVTQLIQSQASNGSNNGSNNSGSSPAAPATPAPQTLTAAPATQPEISPLKPYKGELKLDKIVTADLESLINQGNNEVFMAAWHNGKESKIFDIKTHNYDTNAMLK